MIDTNALVNIGFALVASFSNAVHIPHEAVPTKPEDLRKCVIGGPPPRSATAMYLVDRRGTEFWIKDGVVETYRTPGSYYQSHDPGRIPRLQGIPTLTSNQVVELATTTIGRLAKQTNAVTGAPAVRIPGAADDRIPFYWITWPQTNALGQPDYAAFLEIDARKGWVTYLDLHGKGFFDLALALQISNKVVSPDPGPKQPSRWELQHYPARKRVLPYPATNDVVAGIKSWLWLCNRLGLDPGSETNLASVDWAMSFAYTNPAVSPLLPVSQVHLSNGARFESIGGVAFNYCAPDACFAGFWQDMTREERDRFKGRVLKRWQDLAKELEVRLVERVGIPKQLLGPYSAGEEIHHTELGTEDTKRTVIEWRNWPRNAKRVVLVDETTLAFHAEFDVETGELKLIAFCAPRFIGALRVAQATRQ